MLSTPLEAVYDKRLKCILPDRVAAMLHMPLSEIARIADVHRNTLTRAPGSSKVQTRLGEVMRILTEASDMMGDDLAKAAIWFRHQPLSGFDGQTAEELVASGHAQAVVTHLAMLRDGVYA
jgi:putative toxin-antitoxin system antitoxin component (TIGR02293 family)